MTDTIDVLYIHSPITYSIGRQLLANGEIRNPLVICGRKTQWNGPHLEVVDDGIWNAERVRDFLKTMLDALPSKRPIQLNVYLPHTGFLLGKLLKMSPLVGRICYIEEGDTSHDPRLSQNKQNLAIPIENYAAMFKRDHLLERLGITDDMMRGINEMEAIWFDGNHPKYGGAYSVLPTSFPALSNVRRLSLALREDVPDREKIWVCMLPNIVSLASRYDNNQATLQKILYALVILLRAQSALAASMSCSILVKLHPVDEANLSEEFKAELMHDAGPYLDFFSDRGLDSGYEPALYGFGKYIVINISSASRYVSQILGQERLVNIALD
ncbi:hypothetical protein PMI16_01223 [Herbaspirillum sp. CF444]|uniref:hypothetical protein n=1 Tax=Herbaspirillum sp. CF444 TaxID=1144319 RepID=UPI0002723376|nr:hypothetical protein [Herbaspirillum sp. CF444]EJL92109.1 hypothetical protein PMI16_01223 [Herbaspirillum sp. CF444]